MQTSEEAQAIIKERRPDLNVSWSLMLKFTSMNMMMYFHWKWSDYIPDSGNLYAIEHLEY